MLTAILEGKKQGTGLAGLRLLIDKSEGAEDVLTSTVFERLAYLPDEVLSSLMDLIIADSGSAFGKLTGIEFWPSWQLNNERIEPDVVLRSENYTVIVEAKRHDVIQQQSSEQLSRELAAGWESGEIQGSCLLLTIGGLKDYSRTNSNKLKLEIDHHLAQGSIHQNYELISLSWSALYSLIEQAVEQEIDYGQGLNRLCSDIARAYAWHGLRAHPPLWLSELSTSGPQEHSFEHWSWSLASVTAHKNPATVSSLKNTLANLVHIAITTTPGSFQFLETK